MRNVFERHRKHTDFMRYSTLVYSCGGQALSLGMIQYSSTGEEHPISPHRHPRSGKKFIPTAPSTKSKLLEEATERKGPSRIHDDVSEAVGRMLDCEHFLQTCLETVSKCKTHVNESQAKLKRMSLPLCLNSQRRIKQFILAMDTIPKGCLLS